MIENQKAYTRTRKIQVRDDKIFYRLCADNKVDILTYHPELIKILKWTKLLPFRDGGRLRLKYNNKGATINMYLYDIALGCYTGQIKAETFIDDLHYYYLNKNVNSLDVDHLDGNVYNNTIYNLSLMSHKNNMSKNDITSRVKLPHKLVCAYSKGEYKIELTLLANSNAFEMLYNYCVSKKIPKIKPTQIYAIERYICNDEYELVNTLKGITKNTRDWAEPLRNNQKWLQQDNNNYAIDTLKAIEEQQRVAELSDQVFQRYISYTTC